MISFNLTVNFPAYTRLKSEITHKKLSYFLPRRTKDCPSVLVRWIVKKYYSSSYVVTLAYQWCVIPRSTSLFYISNRFISN